MAVGAPIGVPSIANSLGKTFVRKLVRNDAIRFGELNDERNLEHLHRDNIYSGAGK